MATLVATVPFDGEKSKPFEVVSCVSSVVVLLCDTRCVARPVVLCVTMVVTPLCCMLVSDMGAEKVRSSLQSSRLIELVGTLVGAFPILMV